MGQKRFKSLGNDKSVKMGQKGGIGVLLLVFLFGIMLGHAFHHVAYNIFDNTTTERSMLAKTTTMRTMNHHYFSHSSLCEPGVVYREAGFPAIRTRQELGQLLEEKGFKTGAEVGVQKGKNSKIMLTGWTSCEEFHLIDLWAQQENYKDAANVKNQKQEYFFKSAQTNVEPWKNITKFYRMLSVEAAPKIADQSLDFVYIDARHDYCGVMEDIRAYWPKLRPGGIMAGHDYLTASEVKVQDWSICVDGTVNVGAVRGAVEEFAKEYGLVISVTYRENNWNTWLVQKPTIPECVHKLK